MFRFLRHTLESFFVSWTFLWLNLFTSIIGIISLTLYVPSGLLLWFMKKSSSRQQKEEALKEIREAFEEE